MFDDPHEACNASPGNPLRSINEREALAFLKGWHEDRKGRADEPGPKDFSTSQLERDVGNCRIRLRMKDWG